MLPILSKVYETVKNEQLFSYFVGKFHAFRSAFQESYSCQSLSLKAVDDWKCALDQSLITGVVFMDLSKAFDCLPHSLLIAKLHAYGVDLSACELLAEYLSHRLQCVKIGTARSSWTGLTKGVPQGSISGPYWFIYSSMTYFFLLKNAPSIIIPMTIQCLIRHKPCKLPCQIYSLTAELLLNGSVIMEWKQTLINSNLWYYCQTWLMTLNWSWMKIHHSDLKNLSRLRVSS